MPFPSYTNSEVTIPGSEGLVDIAFDGVNLWIVDSIGNLIVFDPVAQVVLNTFTLTTNNAVGVCFDGTHIWCAFDDGSGDAYLAKFTAATQTLIGTYLYHTNAQVAHICSDGTNIWCPNTNLNSITKVLIATGGVVGTYGLGSTNPVDCCSDGTHTWVACINSVTKLLSSTGALISDTPIGSDNVRGVGGVGSGSIWATSGGELYKLDQTTDAILDIVNLAVDPPTSRGPRLQGVMWDGAYIWVCDGRFGGDNAIFAIDPVTDAQLAVFDCVVDGQTVRSASQDGNVWIVNQDFSANMNLLSVPTPPVEGCPTAWLSINEPGSLSPFVPNTWTDQSHYLHTTESITFSWIARQRGTAKVPLYIAGDDDYMPTIGSQVCLWDITEDADYEVFSGTIDDFEVKWLGINGDRIVTMTCVSLEQVFDTIRLPALRFSDKTAGFIFTALFEYAAGGPVTLGTVDDGVTIAEFVIADFPSIAEMFTRLATESQFVWGVDPGTGTLYFHAPETTPSPFTLDSEAVLWEQMTLKEERHDYRNRQILKPNTNAAILSKELFSGSAQSSFTMLRPVQQITNAWLTQNRQNFATGTFTGQPSVGDVISFKTPGSGSTYNWSAGGTYAVGAIIIDSNGFIQKVTTSVGVTGGTEPAWIEIYGQITQDNLVQWQNQGPSGFQNGDLADYTFVDSLEGYFGPGGLWPITADNPTGQVPANAQFGLVLIGDTLADTIQNLADAINAIQTLAGVTFSLATWENPVVNADTPAGATTIIVRNKAAEASYITALDKVCANFSWSSPVTEGGLTTFGTVVITFGQAGQTTGGSVFTIVYTPGSPIIQSATPLQPGNYLQIEYLATNAGFVQVEDTAQVLQRAAIEGGTGLYQQSSSDDTAVSLPVALQLAQQQLAAFVVIPKTFEFTTMRAGLYVGQILDIVLSNPSDAPALINASWFIQEIQAEVIPVYGEDGASDRWLPGGGHFRYTVTCIDVAQIGSWIDFWLGLGGGGSGSSVNGSGGALGSSGNATAAGGVNEQTADYTALDIDNGRIISMHSISSPVVALTLTLPPAPPSTTWNIFVQNTGSTNLDVDPNGLELDGVAAVLTLTPGQGIYVSTDGINYFTERGLGSGGGSVSVYRQTFAAVSSVVVTHGLGTFAVSVSVYENIAGVPTWSIPSSVELTDANTVTVTFGVVTTGSCVVIGG